MTTGSLSYVGPVVRAVALEKRYGHGGGTVQALRAVDLEVATGETLAVMGPRGCGKSTLLHLLGGLERPSAGEVWLTGRRIDGLSEKALWSRSLPSTPSSSRGPRCSTPATPRHSLGRWARLQSR